MHENRMQHWVVGCLLLAVGLIGGGRRLVMVLSPHFRDVMMAGGVSPAMIWAWWTIGTLAFLAVGVGGLSLLLGRRWGMQIGVGGLVVLMLLTLNNIVRCVLLALGRVKMDTTGPAFDPLRQDPNLARAAEGMWPTISWAMAALQFVFVVILSLSLLYTIRRLRQMGPPPAAPAPEPPGSGL